MPPPEGSPPLAPQPPAPPAPRAPETAQDAAVPRAVAWTLGDIVFTFLAGIGLGVILALAVLSLLPAMGFGSAIAIGAVIVSVSQLLAGWLIVVRRRAVALDALGFRWVGWGALLLMVPITAGALFAIGIVVQLLSPLLENLDAPTAQQQLLGDSNEMTGGDLAGLLVAVAIAVPVAEEFLFRGLIYRYLRGRKTPTFAVLVSAALFAAAHGVPALLPTLFLLGLVLAWVTEHYDSLYPAIVVHGLNNALAVVVLYNILN